MVNPGHRSKGCQRCRQSKVKCDEKRPACGRCTRTGHVCPGYRNAEPDFRPMNTASEASVQIRVHERRHIRDIFHSKSEPGNERSMRSRRSPSIPSLLSPDWTDQCISFFIAEHAEQPDPFHSTWGHLEFVPDMYSKSSAIHLPEAVKAASYAHFANKSSIQKFNHMAKQSYGKALLDLGAAMRDRSRAVDDETLAAMNVLALYEMIAGEQPFSEVFHAHYRGQSAILRMRDREQNSSRWGKNLFATTNRGLIWKDMATLSRPSLGLADWPSSTYPSALAEASARLSVRAADVRGRVGQILSTAPLHRGESWRTELRAVAFEALNTDHDIRNCPSLTPEEWRPRSLPMRFSTPPSVRRTPEQADIHDSEEEITPYPSRIDVYPTHSIATLWNFVRIARLHLLRAMLHLAELDVESPVFASGQSCIPLPEIIHENMQSTIEDICAAVPFVRLIILFLFLSE